MGLFDFRLLSFIGIKIPPKAPWKKFYSKNDMKIELKDENIYDFLLDKVDEHNWYSHVAISYFGKKFTYQELIDKIDLCASKFITLGVQRYDIVSILSANVPEAVIAFYALNKIGAVANMLHPLLSQNEIKDALNLYESKYLLALETSLKNVDRIIDDTSVSKVIILSPSTSMDLITKIGYKFKMRKRKYKVKSSKYLSWNDFMKIESGVLSININFKKDDPAVIFQSGGTTGSPKGIVLSQGNMNASTISAINVVPELNEDDKILGIMPIFHGFGLEVSINVALCSGAEIVLIPLFQANKFHELLKKHKPSILIGVPTLFEALLTNDKMKNVSLSNLKYVISGGDSLSRDRVERINDFLFEHGARTKMIQGYGLTEAVSAVSLDLKHYSRPGTIGIPWPGIYIGIFEPNTDNRLDYNQDGEICVCGPTVMLGYYDNDAETNIALRHHSDGNIWLHTGDIGSMDGNGFITYKQRLKRMIVSSGYNVYPSQVEEVLERYEAIEAASVIGIPHPYKMEVPKAFIVLKNGYHYNDELKSDLIKYCKKNLSIYAIPKEFEVLDKLPKTVIGKVDFNKLKEKDRKERNI